MKGAWLTVVSAVCVLYGAPVLSQEGGSDDMGTSSLAQQVESQLTEPQRSFPYFEHHGYFRFRADNFWNLDLDTQGTSPILPPLEATEPFQENLAELADPDAELLASANLRFRYHPIFHITDTARLHLELDILDNIVLGSTPDGFTNYSSDPNNRFDVPLVGFTPGQQSPNEDLTFRDAIRVRQAYAEMDFLGKIRVGRMASNWGLGILSNGGGAYGTLPLTPRTSHRGVALQGFNCVDCDFGDVVDRFLFLTRIPGIETLYVAFLYDWASSGTVSYVEDQPFGQAMDLSQLDDVEQFGFILGRFFFTDDERSERQRRLMELNQPILEAGAYVIHRSQDAEQGQGGFEPNDNETALYMRTAEAWIPDLWVRLMWVPKFQHRLRLELEAVAILGSIDNVEPGLPDDDGSSSRDLQQFGVAFESDYRYRNLTAGLNGGFASGRSTEGENARLRPGWGVLDDNPVTAGDENDLEVTNFKFDRDYFVDQIMFRQIIGAITNAIYFNPFVQYDFYRAQANALGFRFDGIYALAPASETTPGGDSAIGLELDALLYYHSETYQAGVSYGIFFPMGAFDGVPDRARIPAIASFYGLENTYEEAVSAAVAHTLQFSLMWAF